MKFVGKLFFGAILLSVAFAAQALPASTITIHAHVVDHSRGSLPLSNFRAIGQISAYATGHDEHVWIPMPWPLGGDNGGAYLFPQGEHINARLTEATPDGKGDITLKLTFKEQDWNAKYSKKQNWVNYRVAFGPKDLTIFDDKQGQPFANMAAFVDFRRSPKAKSGKHVKVQLWRSHQYGQNEIESRLVGVSDYRVVTIPEGDAEVFFDVEIRPGK